MKQAITDYHHIIAEIEDYAFLLLDKNGAIIDWNKGAEKLKGYTAVEIIGQNFRVFYTEEDRKNKLPEKLIAKAISVGKAMDEGWRLRKDGSRFWGSILITALHDREGRVKGFQKITRDLSETKKLEEDLRHTNDDLEIRVKDRTKKLVKANRLYAFISAVNQSIVLLSDEQALLDNACKIAQEIGEFKMAWIAMLDRDRMLHIISVHGDALGAKIVMKHSGIHADDPIMKDILTGRVLRSGKYEYSNNMQHDPAYERWREEFISQGIHASIALPIIRGGTVAGVFSLQAGSKGFFDESEITLLEEAAGDISFALDNFDKEKKRRLAEEKVLQSEANLKHAQRIAKVGSWEMDLKTNRSIWSEELCRIFGLLPDENLQSIHSFLSFTHPDDLDIVTHTLTESYANHTDTSFTHRIIRRDGAVRYIQSERRFEFDTQGNAVDLHGIVRDITEKKEAEVLLRDSNALFRGLFESAPEAITIFDCDTVKFIDANANAVSMFGYTLEELMSKSPHALSPEFQPDGRPSPEKSGEMIGRTLSGERVIFEWVHLNADGKELDCEIRLTKLEIPGRNLIRGSVIDISERKKAAALLEAQRLEMETLLNNTEESFILLDTDLNMVSYNKIANDKAISLIHAPLYKGMPIFQLADPRNIPTLKEIYKKVLKGESAETQVRSKLGGTEELVFRNSIKPVFDDARAVIGVFISAADVTEKIKAEIKIRELNEHLEERVQERTAELSEANKALEAFSYSVSHDLMAPVRSMIGFTKIIRQDHAARMEPEANELLGYIEDSGKRMNEIINDLLKLARYGKDEIKLETVDMNWLISGVWLNIGRTNPNHAILEMAALPMVDVDMGMMQQVVVNLLTNAIKYSSKIVKPVVRIWCESDEKSHTFFFKDNGAGFDMKHYDRLFGAFQRLHSMHEYEGTGVGLTLVKRIIEKHGGTIAADAEVGKGATFYFSLPVTSIVG
jgi:PAS domain S-box-containing protein